MEAAGNSLQSALRNLVSDASDQLNDADARALTSASSMGGNIISNLQSQATDNRFDGRIRDVQRDAERNGWTQESRQLVNGMRKQQSSESQDARHLGGLTFSSPSGGYTGGGISSGIPSMGNDLDSLAALLGKYRGNNEYNSHAMGVGLDSNYKQALNDEDEGVESTLKPAYDQEMTRGNLENALLRQQLAATSAANAPKPVGSGWSHPEQQQGVQVTQQFPQRIAQPDPYKQIRDAALQAAMNYMGLQNPHLLRQRTGGSI